MLRYLLSTNNFMIKKVFLLNLLFMGVVNSSQLTHDERVEPFHRTLLSSTSMPSQLSSSSVDDFNDLLQKIHFEGDITFLNGTDKKITLKLTLRSSEHPHSSYFSPLTVTNFVYTFTHIIGEAVSYSHIPFSLKKPKESLNQKKDTKKPKKTSIFLDALKQKVDFDGHYPKLISLNPLTVQVNSKPYLIFPFPLANFNFTPHAFYNLEVSSSSHGWVKDKTFTPFKSPGHHPHYTPGCDNNFERQFDRHLVYLTQVQCPQEGILPATLLFRQRQRLFEEHAFTSIVNCELNLPSHKLLKILSHQSCVRIPLLTHKIWLTNPNDPSEIPQRYLEWARQSMATMPPSQGWQHNLWIQDKKLLPHTVAGTKYLGIHIKVIDKDLKHFKGEACFQQALQQNKFGCASDILRYAILNQEGGLYLDTDYIIRQSPLIFNSLYNFYVGIEPMSAFVGNSLIAASPNHPVMETALDLIERNFSLQAPAYIRNIPEGDGFKTIQTTGPGMLTIATYLSAGQEGNKDIIFPPVVLYPTTHPEVYPQPGTSVLKADDPLPPESLGVHLWEGTWIKVG